LQLALHRLNSRPAESAYVGDAPEDIQMGRAANVLTVAVRSDYPSSTRLLSAQPDIYLESLSSMAEHFQK
jgi:phosphoglycolate phosphatase-like HAD superfamily hydrolase